MNFLIFGLFLIEFCSAFGCRREKDRIKKLYQQKRELQIERDQLAAEKGRFYHEYIDEINEVNEENRKLKEENEELKRKLDALQTKPTEITPIKTSDAILVIPGASEGGVASSYLMKKDGSTQIPAQINAATNDYAKWAKYALVKGQLFIFGGSSDYRKIARLRSAAAFGFPYQKSTYLSAFVDTINKLDTCTVF